MCGEPESAREGHSGRRRLLFLLSGSELDRISDEELADLIEAALAEAFPGSGCPSEVPQSNHTPSRASCSQSLGADATLPNGSQCGTHKLTPRRCPIPKESDDQ